MHWKYPTNDLNLFISILKRLSYIESLITTNMKKIFLLTCCTLLSMMGFTQQNTVASGGDGSGTGGSFSYSIGQIDYINTSGSLYISEGVQQPYEYYDILGLSDLQPIITSIYPNPASEAIVLEISQVNLGLTYNLFDAKGRLISSSSITESKTIVDLQSLSQGTYILKISDSKESLSTLKFIKY